MKKVPWYRKPWALRLFAPFKAGQSVYLQVEYGYQTVLVVMEEEKLELIFPASFSWHEQLAPDDDGLRYLVVKAKRTYSRPVSPTSSPIEEKRYEEQQPKGEGLKYSGS